MNILTAPTERPPISTMGTVSSLPERMGSDLLWQSPHGLVGVQRKAHSDLIASVRDNRLGVELEQMQALFLGVVIIEGMPTYTIDGQLLSKHVQWSLAQQRGVEWSIQQKGIMVTHTRTVAETVQAVEHLYRRTQEAEHESSLLKRPGPQRNGWGKLTDRATAIYLMSGIPGLGIELSTRLYEHFGRCILGLVVSEEQLLDVEGLGPKKVASILKALT